MQLIHKRVLQDIRKIHIVLLGDGIEPCRYGQCLFDRSVAEFLTILDRIGIDKRNKFVFPDSHFFYRCGLRDRIIIILKGREHKRQYIVCILYCFFKCISVCIAVIDIGEMNIIPFLIMGEDGRINIFHSSSFLRGSLDPRLPENIIECLVFYFLTVVPWYREFLFGDRTVPYFMICAVVMKRTAVTFEQLFEFAVFHRIIPFCNILYHVI